jgi:hypothetical protein
MVSIQVLHKPSIGASSANIETILEKSTQFTYEFGTSLNTKAFSML